MQATGRHLLLVVCLCSNLAAGEDPPQPAVDLGITVQDKSEAEERLNAKGVSLKIRRCVVVSHVDPRGPSAGKLVVDNAITTVAGVPTPDVASFNAAVASLKPGNAVEIKGLYLAAGSDRQPEWKIGSVMVTPAVVAASLPAGPAGAGAAAAKPDASGKPPIVIQAVGEDPVNAALCQAPVCPTPFEITQEVLQALGLTRSGSAPARAGGAWPEEIPFARDATLRLAVWESHACQQRYASIFKESNDEASLWNLASGRLLTIQDKQVTDLYAPLAFSPDGKYVASTDGAVIRVWEITGDDTLRLSCSAPTDAKGALYWRGNECLEIWSPGTRKTACLLLGDHTLTPIPDPRIPVGAEADLEILASAGNSAGLLVSLVENRRNDQTILQTNDTRTGRVVAATPCKEPLVDLLPVPDAHRLTSLYCTVDNARALLCLASEDRKENRVWIIDPQTLKPSGCISLDPRDSIAALSRDDTRLAVLRGEIVKTRTATEARWSVSIYDLTRGQLVSAFSLGDEFASCSSRDTTSVTRPQLSFSIDGQHVYAAGVVETKSAAATREADLAHLAVGVWKAADGSRRRVVKRRESEEERQWGDHNGVALCDGGLAVFRVKDVIMLTPVDDLIKTGELIAEGHEHAKKEDYKAAYEKYATAMEAGHEWFFRDQYPDMLRVAFDVFAGSREEKKARAVIEVTAAARWRLAPKTDAGTQLLETYVAEIREREAQAVARQREEFARFREANRARHVPCARMTRREFVKHLDECKTHGMIGPPNTLLQFLDFSFVDAIGEPDKTIELGDNHTEWGFRCKDGWVWLKVTGNAAQGVIVVTGLELR